MSDHDASTQTGGSDINPRDAPFTDEELNSRMTQSSKKFWNWLRNLDWKTIRHPEPPNEDLREKFAVNLVHQEVMRELVLFVERDKKNWEHLLNAISKVYGGGIPPSEFQKWQKDFLRWKDEIKERNEGLDRLNLIEDMTLDIPPLSLDKIPAEKGAIDVGIIGAGVSGLYAGRLFDWLNEYINTHPDGEKYRVTDAQGKLVNKFNFDILEATNRVGGRIYTHHFSPRSHDYYDVGAMRFPDIEIQKKTFDLFEDVGLYKPEVKTGAQTEEPRRCECNRNLPESQISTCKCNLAMVDGRAPLLPYLMSSDKTPKYYNDKQYYPTPKQQPPPSPKNDDEEKQPTYEEIRKIIDDYKKSRGPKDKVEVPDKEIAEYDIFNISTKSAGDVPYEYVKLGAGNVLKYVYLPFKYLLRYNFYVGYSALMKFEDFTVREFLKRVCKFDFYTINWLETSDSATGWFDLAFTEAVIESFTFDTPVVCETSGVHSTHSYKISSETKWYCVEGGTGEVIRRLNDKVSGEPEYNRVVIGMNLARDPKTRATGKRPMQVYLKDEPGKPREYHTVINTTTLGCASRMDLKGVELQSGQNAAIRMLRYGASTKIGVKFTDPWWLKPPFNLNEGGVAPSDLYSCRMCVYPSYNVHDEVDRPAVLLASYCWGQDAERVGAMIKKTSPDGEEILRDCLLRDLARLHHDSRVKDNTHEMSYEKVLAMLRRKYITHYSYDWNHDPFVSGAFAMFGPGQYRRMMPHLQRPAADSRLHFVGEATSNHHAWIVGALESCMRAVCYLLIKTGHYSLINVLFKGYKIKANIEEKEVQVKGWGPLPGYDENIFFWQYVFGLLPPGSQANGQLLETNAESASLSSEVKKN